MDMYFAVGSIGEHFRTSGVKSNETEGETRSRRD